MFSTGTQARIDGPVLDPRPETSTREYATNLSPQPPTGFTEQDSEVFPVPLIVIFKADIISSFQ
jgi:hypothetical protein